MPLFSFHFCCTKITYDFFPHSVSLALFLSAALSLSRPLFLTHFLCVIFPLCSFYLCTLLSYGWSQVYLIRNYHVCVLHTVALCFTFQSRALVWIVECGKQRIVCFFFLLSVASLSCRFTPLLFKLALFTVVYNAFMRERLFYAMLCLVCASIVYTYIVYWVRLCAREAQCARYSPDGLTILLIHHALGSV